MHLLLLLSACAKHSPPASTLAQRCPRSLERLSSPTQRLQCLSSRVAPEVVRTLEDAGSSAALQPLDEDREQYFVLTYRLTAPAFDQETEAPYEQLTADDCLRVIGDALVDGVVRHTSFPENRVSVPGYSEGIPIRGAVSSHPDSGPFPNVDNPLVDTSSMFAAPAGLIMEISTAGPEHSLKLTLSEIPLSRREDGRFEAGGELIQRIGSFPLGELPVALLCGAPPPGEADAAGSPAEAPALRARTVETSCRAHEDLAKDCALARAQDALAALEGLPWRAAGSCAPLSELPGLACSAQPTGGGSPDHCFTATCTWSH